MLFDRVTAVPMGNIAEQVPGLDPTEQLMPDGVLVIVPVLLVPAALTVRVAAVELKVAVTAAFALNVTAHVLVPVHAPLHPPKDEPEAAVAVRVTAMPEAKLAVHVVPQLIPAGLLVTVPLPLPARVTVKVGCVGGGGVAANVAVTVELAVSLTVHVVPEHAPPHPVKLEPELAVAVSVTEVPWSKFAEQVVGQLIPLGLLVMVPLPVVVTVN